MNKSKTVRAWSSAVGTATVAALALGLFAGAPAQAAAGDISDGSGQFLNGTVLNQPDFALKLSNGAATAVNTGAKADVVATTPLDLSALGIINVGSGNIALLGNNGIIRLGALGQYGRAVNDGSSEAFSGLVSGAPSLVTLPADLPTSGDSSLPAAQINVSTAGLLGGTDLVSIKVNVQTLAAAAKQSVDTAPVGAYNVAGVGAEVGGSLVQGVSNTLNPVLNPVLDALKIAGVTIANPLAGGTIAISEAELLAVAGVASINALPAGTDLLQFLPQAVVTKLTKIVNDLMTSINTEVGKLGLAGLALRPLVATLQGVVTPLLNGLGTSLLAPLSSAISDLAALNLNIKGTTAGKFTQSALQLTLLKGNLASIPLASASVGPNLTTAAIPVFNKDSIAIAGGLGLIVLLGMFVIRRRRNGAVSTAAMA
ncbi:PVV-CTERM domain-containing choice-of-anchor G protein [Arthrobacter sp. HLT1-20]